MSQFSQLVESLHRLYNSGRINKDHVIKLLMDNKLTQDEFNYIVGE